MSADTYYYVNQGMKDATGAMLVLGDAAAKTIPHVEGFQRALRAARHRALRPYIVAERKKFRIIARRWRRAEIEANRRPALIHKGGKP